MASGKKSLKAISWWQGILLILAAFFAVFAFIFFQRAGVSSSDIEISIQGPDTFRAQESTEFKVTFANGSESDLQDVAIFVTLPDFLAFEDSDSPERKIELIPVASGGEVVNSFTIFSKESDRGGVIRVRAEYLLKNLQGKFESVSEKHISVSSLPLTVIFDIPQKVVNGQRISGSFHFVASKEIETLPLYAMIDLPDGFTLEDAEPIPFEDTVWRFNEVEPDKSYQVQFEGVMRGSEEDEKIFKLMFGDIKDDGTFRAQYTNERTISISSATLEFSQKVNGKEEYIASPGEELAFSIVYANKSGVNIEDITITAQLTGDAFDFDTLDAGLGYFNKNTRTIIWDKNFMQKLTKLDNEEGGEIKFSISLAQDLTPKNHKDKDIFGTSYAVIESSKIPLALKGLSLRAEDTAEFKVRTSLDLFTRAYYYEGPFSNSGPIPPKVAEKTTYTILWQVTNTFNDTESVKVAAPLGKGVIFEDNIYPNNNNLAYGSSTHSVTWDIGALSSGVGSIFPVETVAFQVSVTPDEDMRDQTFDLIETSKISALDSFTEEFLEAFADPVDSSLPDDIGISPGDGIVQ